MPQHVYRAGPALTRDIRDWEATAKRFRESVVDPWDAEHPDNRSVWRRFGLDQECIGFEDGKPDDKPPAGLSRSQQRTYLIPRGKAGQPWRDVLSKFANYPQAAPILAAYQVQSDIWRFEDHKVYYCGVIPVADDEIYFTWGYPHPDNPELIPVPLSQFYARIESLPADHRAREVLQV